MPVAEYRGGGRRGANVQSMESRWDSEWICLQRLEDISGLASNESWDSIRRNIPPGRVLEAGCGLAKWVAFLDSIGYEAYGLDYSDVAIQQSLAIWPNLRLLRGDLRKMPFDDSFFDGIISFGAIEHDIKGPQAALADMYRVLRSGGFLYCTVPCMNWIRRAGYLSLQNWCVCNRVIRWLAGRRQDVAFFEYVFTPSEYKTMLAKAGYDVIKLIPLSPRGYQNRLNKFIHRRWPWCQAHMMAAICKKP